MSEDQKKKFFEVVLLEKDYSKARLELDLAGVQLTKSLEAWLESYYNSLAGNDPITMEGPLFKLSVNFGDHWIDDLIEICTEEVKKKNHD